MIKSLVLLSLKHTVTTTHDHTLSLMRITHIWPQEPPTAPKAVSADHRAACILEATPLRSTAALMPRASCRCGSLVWTQCNASHTRIASKPARLSCVAAHVTHVETGEKELYGSTSVKRKAVRGPPCLSAYSTESLCSPEYRLAVCCRVRPPVPRQPADAGGRDQECPLPAYDFRHPRLKPTRLQTHSE